MEFAQIRDRVEPDDARAALIDLSALHGTWINSNPETNGIVRMVVSGSGGKLTLQVIATGPNGLIDWGTVEVAVLMSAPSSRVPAGFTCRYDFGFVEIQLQAMILKGLIVLAELHSFKDDSKRVDYFVREYFALEHGRYTNATP
jgi:hypothetical protein